MAFIAGLVRNRSGATVVEYGLIAALISVAIILGLTAIGKSINGTFDLLGNTMTNAQSTTQP